MGSKRQTNTFTGGMNCDLDYSLIKDNQYRYAENIRIVTNDEGSSGVMQNIEGFLRTTSYNNAFMKGTVIHVTTIRDWAIVFTKDDNASTFNIYRIDFSKSELEPDIHTVVLTTELDIAPIDAEQPDKFTISSVCKWENDDLVKIYWCDGTNQIRVLNVAKDMQQVDKDSINIIPNAVLPALELISIGSGSLKAGKYQYAYQLFNPRSFETAVSAMSKMFTAVEGRGATNSQDIIGGEKEENTGIAFTIRTSVPSTAFTRAKIIRLYYKDNTGIPDITIIDDISISEGTLEYEDKGGSFVNELTVDELNALVSYQFTPRVLEAKDNILFAANVTEQTWDILDKDPNDNSRYYYDTRAFRCYTDGSVRLDSNSSNNNYYAASLEDLIANPPAMDHDCICPYNQDPGNLYRYRMTGTGTTMLGGEGENIAFRFITTNLIEDAASYSGLYGFPDDFELSSPSYGIKHLPLYGVNDSSNADKTQVGSITLPQNNNILNYSNPAIDSLVRGYQREEIYRFGIVFYNASNLPSAVHWIADIKMPELSSNDGKLFSSRVNLSYGNVPLGNISVVTHPMGVEFTLKNVNKLLEQGVTGYEIVRCERTIMDRSVLMQGIVSTTVQNAAENATVTPLPYLAYSNKHGLATANNAYEWVFDFSETTASNHFIFISPDLCVNRENADEVLNLATNIEGKAKLRSIITNNGFSSSVSVNGRIEVDTTVTEKILANAPYIKSFDNTYKDVKDLDASESNGFVYTAAHIPMFDIPDAEGNCMSNNAIYIGSTWNDYAATLAKYYDVTYSGTFGSANISDIKMAIETDPYDIVDNAWRNKGLAIGGKTFYNWTYKNRNTDADSDEDNLGKYGPHGVCAVFVSNEMTSRNTLATATSTTREGLWDTNSVILCNLKQTVDPYNGAGYASRQNSVYISTGSYQKLNNDGTNIQNNFCFGGDTYIGIFDYANAMFSWDPNDLESETDDSERGVHKTYNGAYFPCESSVNTSLRSDGFGTSKTYESNGYSNHYVQNNTVQIGSLYSQNKPLYAYNDAYSAQPRAKEFVAKSQYSIDNLTSDTRVLNSQPSTNLELTDSWTKFKVANYIDVDTRFGSINNLELFRNQLFYWQDDAFGTLAVNERSLIQDNNMGQLTLGTGGILTRYDYVTTLNGSKKNQLRNVAQSDSTLYWYDDDRKEICGYNGSLNTVSKLKGVQSYLNDKTVPFSNDPEVVYDKKYNEVLFTLEDKTLVFNEQLGAMTSFYTIKPDRYAEFADKLYTFKGLTVYKYNSGDEADLYTGEDKVSYIQFVVNADYPQSKTFDNVEYAGDFTRNTNMDDIYFETKRQTSYTTNSNQIDYREDTYKFAIPRNNIELNQAEQLANKSYKDRMKGKYLVCHYKYDCNNGNTFKVPYISTAYRYSMI